VGTRFADDGAWASFPDTSLNWDRVENVQTGDYTGDGKDDLMIVHTYDTYIGFLVYKSEGNRFGDDGTWSSSPDFNWDCVKNISSGDFDGDGDNDVLVAYQYSSGVSLNMYRSNGSYFDHMSSWGMLETGFDFNKVFAMSAGIFNSDKMADIFMVYDNYPGLCGIPGFVDNHQDVFVLTSKENTFANTDTGWAAFKADEGNIKNTLGANGLIANTTVGVPFNRAWGDNENPLLSESNNAVSISFNVSMNITNSDVIWVYIEDNNQVKGWTAFNDISTATSFYGVARASRVYNYDPKLTCEAENMSLHGGANIINSSFASGERMVDLSGGYTEWQTNISPERTGYYRILVRVRCDAVNGSDDKYLINNEPYHIYVNGAEKSWHIVESKSYIWDSESQTSVPHAGRKVWYNSGNNNDNYIWLEAETYLSGAPTIKVQAPGNGTHDLTILTKNSRFVPFTDSPHLGTDKDKDGVEDKDDL